MCREGSRNGGTSWNIFRLWRALLKNVLAFFFLLALLLLLLLLQKVISVAASLFEFGVIYLKGDLIPPPNTFCPARTPFQRTVDGMGYELKGVDR